MVLYLVQREERVSFFQSVSLLYSSDILTHISLFLPFLLIHTEELFYAKKLLYKPCFIPNSYIFW
jgi:hypothetical protein